MKLDKFDVIDFENYDLISKNRKQPTVRKSGVMGDFVKHDYAPHLNVINSDCEYVLWFKLSNPYLELIKMFCFVQSIAHLTTLNISEAICTIYFTRSCIDLYATKISLFSSWEISTVELALNLKF